MYLKIERIVQTSIISANEFKRISKQLQLKEWQKTESESSY